MAMMGELAVDLMRFEQRRTEMQQTLDRSVLAAAAMSQRLTAEDVVNDHFGLSQYLSGVETNSGLNYRSVTASASSTIQTFFMHMMGINSITADVGFERGTVHHQCRGFACTGYFRFDAEYAVADH